MTLGKASAITVGFIGAVALGVGIGPFIVDRPATVVSTPAADVASVDSPAETAKPVPARRRNVAPAANAIAPSAPELHALLRPLLNSGADMTLASRDFRSAEQFATVAHAARNTGIPFMLLRHRVVTEGKSLAAAIRESRPDINAPVEANRAAAEARSDLAALGG